MEMERMRALFSVEEELDHGGQAIVYKVVRKRDGQPFACKSIRVTEYKEDELEDLDPDDIPNGGLQEEAEMEIRALSKGKGESGVVQLVDVFRDDDYYHIIMELCECSLKDMLQDRARLSEHEAAMVIKSVARTVSRMHDLGVVHRDIKVGNILLGFGEILFDNIKLADFGTSWVSKGTDMRMRGQVGTDRYVAPEVVASIHEYDERVDVWGVGIVLYEILSGKLAFEGLRSRDVPRRLSHWEDLPVSSMDWTDVSDGARDLILQLLHLDARRRLPIHEVENHPWVVKHSGSQVPDNRSLEEEQHSKRMVFEQPHHGLKRRRGGEEEEEEDFIAKKLQHLGVNRAGQAVH
ncbi:calcium-dependent protein kinase 14 [Selaginella moellendorffii]|nr:calcium-dependent protein kinase 14 [Selaginella moellendorffii]|eukprot:XP_002965273.2 calcium-dependent protein kinase 14 [Selaginella moellendorffii]